MIKHLGQRPLIMGIVNVTPDSFSGDGVMTQKAAIDLALQMIRQGADILDIGGESSRPGATPVSIEEEIRRVIPVITSIMKEFSSRYDRSDSPPLAGRVREGGVQHEPQVRISVDTTKAEVADAAIAAGATIINDISALQGEGMMSLAARSKPYVVLMHNSVKAGAVTQDAWLGSRFDAPDVNGDIIEIVARELGERISAARNAGIAADKIIADPGLGFGKTVEQNLALINRLDELKIRLGLPVLIGPSRKNFIGRILDLPVEERLEGTAACVAVAVMRGADIIRVHDVKEMARVVKMTAIIKEKGQK